MIEGRALPQPGQRRRAPSSAGRGPDRRPCRRRPRLFRSPRVPARTTRRGSSINQLNTKLAELSEAVNAKAASSSAASAEQLSEVRSQIDTVASTGKTADEDGAIRWPRKFRPWSRSPRRLNPPRKRSRPRSPRRSRRSPRRSLRCPRSFLRCPPKSRRFPTASPALSAPRAKGSSDARTAALTLALDKPQTRRRRRPALQHGARRGREPHLAEAADFRPRALQGQGRAVASPISSANSPTRSRATSFRSIITARPTPSWAK